MYLELRTVPHATQPTVLAVTQRRTRGEVIIIANKCIGLSAAIGVQNKEITDIPKHDTSVAVYLFPVANGVLLYKKAGFSGASVYVLRTGLKVGLE